jgi:glyoxylase-like metal-dependent hydrolase (beta-lactamase superfamily II)
VRVLGWLVLAVTLIAGALWWVVGRLDHVQLTDAVHVYTGIGGNVGVLVTGEGVVVVDTMTFVRQGAEIQAEVRRLTPQPIVAVLNTHYHFDHTHGNPAFPVGTKVVSTARTLQHLRERDADFWKDRPAADLLPNDTFDGASKEMRFGGKTIRSLFVGRGHTDGDMVVLFVEDRVVHVGDLCFNGHYPNIDLEAGGSVRLWPAALDKVLALPFDIVIPGHGPPTNRHGLERCRDLMTALWSQTATIRDRGGSVEDALKLVDLEPFALSPLWLSPMLNRGFVIHRTWEELAAARPSS